MTTRRWMVAAAGTALLAGSLAACGSSSPSSGSAGSSPPSEAKARFCDDAADYVTIIDRYGRVFSDQAITVGQVQSDAAALEAARGKIERSADALRDAIAATNAAATSPAGTGGTVGTTTTVLASQTAEDHQKAIATAERELDRTLEGIDTNTPLRQVPAEIQAAAFGVEQAYVALFIDAGCVDGNPAASEALRNYTTGLQTDLTTLGYYTGAIDGLYGPATVTGVKALQASAGLSQTGVVDPATEAALTKQLADKGSQQSLNIAGLQGALTVAGFYTGPIDGTWTPALEAALKAFQDAQNLPATGTLDPATLAALLGLKNAQPEPSITTTSSPPATGSTTTSTSAP